MLSRDILPSICARAWPCLACIVKPMRCEQLNIKFVCSTRAFIFAKKPHLTPAEALAVLAKLEGTSKAEESYV